MFLKKINSASENVYSDTNISIPSRLEADILTRIHFVSTLKSVKWLFLLA